MESMTARLLVLVAGVGLLSCGGSSIELFVDLKTDFAGGGEVARVRTTVISAEDGTTTVEAETPVGFDDDLLAGLRVGEFAGLRRGAYLVRVTLLANGRPVTERTVRAEVRSNTGVTVLITRSCADVRCPAAGDSADRTECLGGSCVPPTCSPTHPEACGEAECATDRDCGEGVACAEPQCVEGFCLLAPDTNACGPSQWCDPDRGCVDREVPAADGGVDASSDAGFDVGGDAGCVADSECDDGNTCTNDVCDSGSCRHIDNAAPCDDGVFCNGADTCAGGTCTGHAGDPCPGMSVCDEANDTCTGCAGDADCPGAIASPWGECAGFSGVCDETGTQSRTLTTYQCVAGTCVPDVAPETRGCTRPTAGITCSDPTYGPWSSCEYPDFCAETGSRTRTVTTYRCEVGTCMPRSPTMESEACNRSTEGLTCDSTLYGDWGPCGGFSDECDESGTQSRNIATFECVAGACQGADDTETRACSRSTNGNFCTGSCRLGTCSAGTCVGGDCPAGQNCYCGGDVCASSPPSACP